MVRVAAVSAAAGAFEHMGPVDDVRLAVAELATALCGAAADDTRLTVEIDVTAGLMTVEGHLSPCQHAPRVSAVGHHFLRSVCSSHDVGRSGSTAWFRMQVDDLDDGAGLL